MRFRVASVLALLIACACAPELGRAPQAGSGGLGGGGGTSGIGAAPSMGGAGMGGAEPVSGTAGTDASGSGGIAGVGGAAPPSGDAGGAGAPEGGAGTAGAAGATAEGGSAGAAGSTAESGAAGSSGAAGAGGAPAVGKRCPAGPFPAPVVQSTKSVCADFDFNHNFNEGPTWIASQSAFFFTNFVVRAASGGDIIKYTPGGSCEIFISDVGCNGLAVSNDGNLLAACHQSRSVIRFDVTTKEPTTIASSYMGMMFDTPNDLVMHSNGSIYFTNPTYELAGRPPGVGFAVFRIDPEGEISRFAQGSCNGIGLSPNERKLYVLQSGMWDLDEEGVPSNRTDLFTSGDGMAVDCAGNVYAAGLIFSAEGARLGQYGSGTNLAFGGADGQTVLVVGGGTQVRELRMNLPGLP